VHVAHLQQALDVRLVGMGGQRIPEEHHGVHIPWTIRAPIWMSPPSGPLPKRSTGKANLLREEGSGMERGQQVQPGQAGAIPLGQAQDETLKDLSMGLALGLGSC